MLNGTDHPIVRCSWVVVECLRAGLVGRIDLGEGTEKYMQETVVGAEERTFFGMFQVPIHLALLLKAAALFLNWSRACLMARFQSKINATSL